MIDAALQVKNKLLAKHILKGRVPFYASKCFVCVYVSVFLCDLPLNFHIKKLLAGAPAKFAMQMESSVCIFCVCHKRDKTVSVTLNPNFTKKERD